MSDRKLRSKAKLDTTLSTIMSIPAAHQMTHSSPSPTQKEKEKPRVIKLTSPKEKPLSTIMENKDQQSNNPTHGPEADNPDSTEFGRLYSLISNLSTTVTTLNQGLKDELQKTGISIREEMSKLEERIVISQDAKYADLTSKIHENRTDQDQKIAALQTENLSMKKTIQENKDKLLAHSYQTSQLQQQMDALTKRVDKNQQDNAEFEVTVNNEMEEMKEATLTALKLANTVEQHGRRWAVRLLGMTAPENGVESKPEAKSKVLKIIHENFKLTHVRPTDIDCAHRLGRVTAKNKQTMIIRFFARDLVDDLSQNKKHLKGSGLILYDDQTQLNRILINTLKDRDDIDEVWTGNGNIWARPKKNGPRFKMYIGDDIEEKLGLDPLPEESNSTSPAPSNPGSTNHTPPPANAGPATPPAAAAQTAPPANTG